MKILFRDQHIIICIKPAGVLSTDEAGGMPGLIRQVLGEDQSVYAVHRLDSVVSGLMVYALTHEAASGLSSQIEAGSFSKEYLAVIEGRPEKKSGQLHDYLRRNQKERKTYAVDKKDRQAQEAELIYHTMGMADDLSLVRVKLITGRTHQIRAQFSSRHLPLYGDGKYGSSHKTARIALWSCHLKFRHPVSGQVMDFSAMPPSRQPWTIFKGFYEDYDEADVVMDFKRSERLSDCPYAHICDECRFQGMDYEKSLEKKAKQVSKWMKAMGICHEIVAADQVKQYKNKVLVSFVEGKNGGLVSGLYSKSEKKVLRISTCLNHAEGTDEIVHSLRTLMQEHSVPAFEEKENRGWLRKALLRVSSLNGDVMLVIVAASEDIGCEGVILDALVSRHPEIKTVVLNVNAGRTAAVLGKEERILMGSGYIEDELCGKRFRIYTKTAFPVHHAQAESYYGLAMEKAELRGTERVLDLGCGIGIMSILAAGESQRILAVDRSREAIAEAEQNAKLNGITNIKWICRDPADYVRAMAGSRERFDRVFLNIDAGWLSNKALKDVAALKAKYLICSCSNLESASKNIELLRGLGYKQCEIRPVDTLPYASGMDLLIRMSR